MQAVGLTATVHISGLHSAAYTLDPPNFAPRIAPTHAGFSTARPAGFEQVGLLIC